MEALNPAIPRGKKFLSELCSVGEVEAKALSQVPSLEAPFAALDSALLSIPAQVAAVLADNAGKACMDVTKWLANSTLEALWGGTKVLGRAALNTPAIPVWT